MGQRAQPEDSPRAGPRTANRGTASPLKVGLLVDSLAQPAWARKLVADIQASSFARVALVVKRGAPRTARRHLLHDLYLRLDRRIFRDEPDAFATAELGDLLRDCAVLEAARPPLDALRAHDLDVLLALAPDPEGAYESAARHGVWSVGLPAPDEALPGVLEVFRAHPTTVARLEVRRSGRRRVVCRSPGPTDHVSLQRNRNALYWKSAAIVLRRLRDLAAEGTLAEERESAPPAPRPGSVAMAGLALRLALRYLRGKVRDCLAREQWYWAYRFEEGPRDGFDGLVEFMPPRDRYWADPFPARGPDGRRYVFFEELRYRDGKGRIMAVEVDPQRGAGRPFEVLARSYHLSYPFVFEWQGRHYMVPESSANGTVTLFRCDSFPDKWVEERDLLRDIRAVDATLVEADGRWWMFVNVAPFGGSFHDELHLFYADTPLGPWTPHPRNPVKSDCRGARPAGRLFRRDGELYRPAQNCAGGYGTSIVIHRVDALSREEYRETPVAEIRPTWERKARRIHTINRGEGLLVLDLLRRRRRFF